MDHALQTELAGVVAAAQLTPSQQSRERNARDHLVEAMDSILTEYGTLVVNADIKAAVPSQASTYELNVLMFVPLLSTKAAFI